MPKTFVISLNLLFLFLMVSCKNEPKSGKTEKPASEIAEKHIKKRKKKKELTQNDIDEINSIMYRIMTTPELKRFSSYVVTAGLADMLSNEKGPFTVFAPTSQSIEMISAERKKFLSIPENKPELQEMLKRHIVEGKINSETLLQEINKKGKLTLKTVDGNILTASKSGEEIIIADGKGGRAIVKKSDIAGSNGMLFVVDGVLNEN